MTWQQFMALAAAHFLALLSPGPDFFLLIHYALSRGRKAACLTAAGIATANAGFILAAMGGVTLLRDEPLAYAFLYWGGCCYLAYLAWQFWCAQMPEVAIGQQTNSDGGDVSYVPFLRGFYSGIFNPKNALFYLTLFAVLAGKNSSFWDRSAAGLWMFCVVLIWDCLVACTFTLPGIMASFNRQQLRVHRVSALILWGIVAVMIWHPLSTFWVGI